MLGDPDPALGWLRWLAAWSLCAPRGVRVPARWELGGLSWRVRNLLAQWRLVPAPQTMKTHGVRNIVFSSSATVYGDPKYLPLDENHPVGGCTNPYGKSKYFIEEMIQDLCKAERVRSCPQARRAGNRDLFLVECSGVTPPPLCVSPGLERRSPALFQPHWCPRVRHDRRRSSGDPEQPHALRGAGTAPPQPLRSPGLVVPAQGTG